MPNNKKDRQVAIWLFICCFSVFLMIVVGGLTRLTESGLSIVEWKPISGTFPPLNDEAWQKEFENYKQYPEFKNKNFDMTIEGFKGIFWLEFIHRLLGRIAGLIFLIPLAYFAYKKYINFNDTLKFAAIFALGGVQGFIGWYMVKSGLVENPQVSPYRLALHLSLAIVILTFLFLKALDFWGINKQVKKTNNKTFSGLKKISVWVSGVIFLQIVAGAFVAGLDAGLTYNTYPLMDGKLIPDGMFVLQPLLINLFENITAVQFNHRWIAFIVLGAVLFLWFRIENLPKIEKQIILASRVLLTACLLQIVIGIATLLLVVPIFLASLHQSVAIFIFVVSLFINKNLYVKVRTDKGI